MPDVLIRPREQVASTLDMLIERGNTELANGRNTPSDQIATWAATLEGWHNLVRHALEASYESAEPADEFVESVTRGVRATDFSPEGHELLTVATERGLAQLGALRDRLAFAVEPSVSGQRPAEPSSAVTEPSGRSIFLVHGHDEAVKESVARFLERVTSSSVTVLHEQADRGRTIIEKFEEYAAEAGYAVVLLTGDDEGRPSGEDQFRPRARQNVILELGFFVGRLGRSRVALLYESGVELPSDIQGVLFLALDSGGGWKTKLAGEMLEAGVSVDPKKVLLA